MKENGPVYSAGAIHEHVVMDDDEQSTNIIRAVQYSPQTNTKKNVETTMYFTVKNILFHRKHAAESSKQNDNLSFHV